MLRAKNAWWFKVCAGLTAALTAWFGAEASVLLESARQARARAHRAEDVAARLGVDVRSVRGGAAWDDAERSAAAERRTKALGRLRAIAQGPRADRERASALRAEIERRHLPSLLGGLARSTEEAGEVTSVVGDVPPAASERLEAARASIGRSLRLVGPAEGPLRQALDRARALEGALSGVRKGKKLERATADRIRAAANGSQRKPAVERRSPFAEPARPPEPRKAVRLGTVPSPEQRALYAELIGTPGLEIESPAGLLSAEEIAAGLAPEARIAAAHDAGALVRALSLSAIGQPTDGDLGEDELTRLTPEIRRLAADLGGDPLAIYGFVHDGTDAEPYYGAKKGAAGALLARSGNDADLSSLLVALLRASGIPARYEYGTVDLSPAQAMAWTGTTDPSHAADVLQTGGVPTVQILDGARVKSIRVEHVWVRAWVPYSNYRGIARPGSRATWVRLDPVLKQARIAPARDLRGKVRFDEAAFLGGRIERMPLGAYEDQLRGWLAANRIECATLDELIPRRQRIADGLTVLPAELPSPVVASLATFTVLPQSMKHGARIGVGGWSATIDLASVYGRSVSVRYRGATAADQAAIEAAGGIDALAKPWTVRLVPYASLDGAEIGRGEPVLAGTGQAVTVTLSSPFRGVEQRRHHVRAGSVWALGFAVDAVPEAVPAAAEAALARAIALGKTGDDLEEARANRAIWRYFAGAQRDGERALGLGWGRLGYVVSEGIAGREIEADVLYGVPVALRPGRNVIDVTAGWSPYSVDGNDAELPRSSHLALWQASAWEHKVWEMTLNVPAISTVRILQAARQQGVEVLEIVPGQASVIDGLPYSEAARQDLRDGLHAGLRARVPARPITWGVYETKEGYVLWDPATGGGAFRLAGFYSGGEGKGQGSSSGGECPPCSGSEAAGHSTVSVTTGAMRFAETDLAVPARGIPVNFVRRYDSSSPHGGRLGPGWQHSYEVKLVPQPAGALLFVNDGFRTQRFTETPAGWTAEPGYHEKLASTASGWTLTFKDGTEYRFRTDGQLASIHATTGHVVTVRYDAAGRPDAVVDATQREALRFSYDAAGMLSGVADLHGRAVAFGHEGGALTSVTDVLGKVQRYGYEGRRKLAWKEDRNGSRVWEFYDGEGRWIGGLDPDGHGRRISYDVANRRAVHLDKRGGATIWEYNANGNPVSVTDPLGNRRTMEWNDRHEKEAEVDARGNRTEMTWDGDGNLLTRRDATGAVTTYTYGPRSRVLTVEGPDGKATVNRYLDDGNLETTTDPTGAVTRYGYTTDGLPEAITQPGGATTTIGYDAAGRVTSLEDAGGGKTILGYDANGHLETITDPAGAVRTLIADAAGRIEKMIDAEGHEVSFEYDAEGNRTAVIDAGGRTVFGYDALDRLVSVTDAAGRVTRTEYDPEGNVTARVDALGRRTSFAYDAGGRLVETVDAAGTVTTQGFCADVGGQPCAIVDGAGHLTEVRLDALGRPHETVDANGRITTEHYDVAGRRDWTRDAAGRLTAYGYDAAGRLEVVTDALGGTTRYGYDPRGNRKAVTDANGHVTTFEYDLANRLRFETNPIGKVTEYRYDAAGNRRFKIDGNGQTTEYRYDRNRRLKKVLFADGSAYDYDYDARGNRTLEKSAHHERVLAHDALGRLERVEDRTLGRTITYGYDPVGNRNRMTLDTGETVEYRWDAVGRLFETIDPQGETTRFRYDAAGRRRRAEYGNGTSAVYGYDAVGQVLSIVYADRAGGVQTAFGYEYDAAGNRKHKAFADGTKEAYGYDALDRLVSVDYPGGRQVEYGYDAVGNRRQLVDTSKGTVTRWAASARASSRYHTSGLGSAGEATGAPNITGCAQATRTAQWVSGFDSWTTSREEWLELDYAKAERVRGVRIHETYGGGFVMRVDLVEEDGTAHTVYEGGDRTACGEWLEVRFPLTSYRVKKVKVVTRAVGPEGIDAVGLEAQVVEDYEYNGFNQLLSVTPSDGGPSTAFAYDGNGNQTSRTDASGVTQYVYGADDRLAGVALPGGGGSAYEYDANGLRVKKADSGGTTRYLLDGLSVIGQYGADGGRQAFYVQSLARIDEVLSVVNGQGKHWYQADALGSIYTLTTASGEVRARGGYDVFGAPVAESGAAVGQPFGFTGREHELESGLVYARARYLSTVHGGWTQADPFTESLTRNGGLGAEPMLRPLAVGVPFPDPEASRYEFGGSRPTVLADPTGLMVVYLGAGATVAVPGSGFTYGVGTAIGTGTGFSFAFALTAGFATQAYGIINVSASIDFSVFWGLEPDEACSIRGPFLNISMDPGLGAGVSLVWSITWPSVKSFMNTGRGSDFAAALGRPVGLTISPGIIPTKWGLPAGGVTITGTWSWLPYSYGCGECG